MTVTRLWSVRIRSSASRRLEIERSGIASNAARRSCASAAWRRRSKRSETTARSARRRSAWRAPSSMFRLSARPASARCRASCAWARAPRSRSSFSSAASSPRRAVSSRATVSSAILSRPGFLSPRDLRARIVSSRCDLARELPLSPPPMLACRRSRSAPSSRSRLSSSSCLIDAVERKKPSFGMPVSSAMIWSARVGSV